MLKRPRSVWSDFAIEIAHVPRFVGFGGLGDLLIARPAHIHHKDLPVGIGQRGQYLFELVVEFLVGFWGFFLSHVIAHGGFFLFDIALFVECPAYRSIFRDCLTALGFFLHLLNAVIYGRQDEVRHVLDQLALGVLAVTLVNLCL